MFRWKMLEGLPVIALFLGATLSAAAQTTTTWVGGSGGEWDFAPHWDNGIPDGNFVARFDTPSDGKAVNIHRVLNPAEPFRLSGLETGISSGLLALFTGPLAFDQSGGGWISAAENSSIEMQNQLEFAGELEARVAATNSGVRFNGNLTSSGSSFLRKTGGGRLRLFGDNSGMTGSETVGGFANVGINLEEGTIAAGDGASLGTGRVRFAGVDSENVTLDLPEATFGNGLIFDHAGTGASRMRTPLGSAVTFTTTDIAGTSRITLTNDGTGSGLALFRFKGAGLSVGNDIEITGASDRMEIGAGFAPSSQSWSGDITSSGRLNVIGNAVLTGNNTYAGLTVVSLGSTLVHGSHTGGGEWRVQGVSTALGGSGFIDSDVIFMSEAKFVFSLTDTLTVANGREVLFDPFFDVANGLVSFELAPVDWALVPAGTYTLIANDSDFSGLSNFGFDNRATGLANGREAWFAQNGGLQLIVIPEPSVVGLLGSALVLLGVARLRGH